MDIKRILNLSYEEYISELKEKYGLVPGNYFLNDTYRTKNTKITRGNEGLYIHHIDEDKAILLGNPEYAKKKAFHFQEADRLVYCNLLEHLILHIKIIENPHPDQYPNEDVGVGGVFGFMIPELNDIYSGITYHLEWKKRAIENIIDLKKEYLECIRYLMKLERKFPLSNYLTSFNYWIGNWELQNNQEIFKSIEQIWKENQN